MKRNVVVTAAGVNISAQIKLPGYLTRQEVELVRDALADRLQEAAANLPFIGSPRNRVRVR